MTLFGFQPLRLIHFVAFDRQLARSANTVMGTKSMSIFLKVMSNQNKKSDSSFIIHNSEMCGGWSDIMQS